MMSRIFQHEYDHVIGKNFTEYASKMKLDLAYKKAEKLMDRAQNLRKKLKEMNDTYPKKSNIDIIK